MEPKPASICRTKPRGIVPSPEWKLRNFRQKWFAGETISVSIGQGQTTVTPLQMARAIGGIAHGRSLAHAASAARRHEDRKAARVGAQSGQREEGRFRHVRRRQRGRHRRPRAASRVSTSAEKPAPRRWLRRNTRRHTSDVKDNAWFVAYAPCDKPEIVVSVLWENVGVQGAHRRADRARHHEGVFRQESSAWPKPKRQADAEVESRQLRSFPR